MTHKKKKKDVFNKDFINDLQEQATEIRISKTLTKKPGTTLLCYSPNVGAGIGGIDLNLLDINCLQRGGYLNDKIVDFYLKYLHLEVLDAPIRDSIQLFSSLFYNSLSHGARAYSDNKRQSGWTKRIPDLLDKKFIVLPFVTEVHWVLAIICNAGHVKNTPVSANDGEEGKPETKRPKLEIEDALDPIDRPLIVLLDSALDYKINHSHVARQLRLFLNSESKFRHSSPITFTKENMPHLSPKVPQQSNSFDCGVYLLQFFQTFFSATLETWLSVIQNDSEDYWFDDFNFTREIEKDKRQRIYQTIRRLMEEDLRSKIYLSILPETIEGLPLDCASGVESKSTKKVANNEYKASTMLNISNNFFNKLGKRIDVKARNGYQLQKSLTAELNAERSEGDGQLEIYSPGQLMTSDSERLIGGGQLEIYQYEITEQSKSLQGGNILSQICSKEESLTSMSELASGSELVLHEKEIERVISLDTSKPITKVRIRLSDGSRLTATLNLCHRVSTIRNIICTLRPEQAMRSFSLMKSFPSQEEFKDESISIEEAQLCQATIIQRLKS